MMTEEQSRTWHPEIVGWADDILPAYEAFVDELPDNAQIVELGVAFGRSVLFLAELLHKRGKRAKILAVDHFAPEHAAGFKRNLATFPQEVQDTIFIVQDETADAAKRVRKAKCDLVFIDAEHTFDGVSLDIDAWLPKLKPNAILAGHDYSTVDFPGVVKGVDEAAAKYVKTLERPTRSVWRLR